MSCTANCPTQDHPTYGACLRSKSLAVTGLESTSPSFTREAEKAHDSELAAYAAARKQGIQPASTQRKHVEAAVEVSQQLGTAFDASAPPVVLPESSVK